MTDYGRGPGYEPWHAEDPLYGDPAGPRPAAPVASGWDPYAPYDPYATGQQYLPDWDGQPLAPQQYPPQQGIPQQYPPQQYPPQSYGGPAAPAAPYQGQPPQGYYGPGGQGAPVGWPPGPEQTGEWQFPAGRVTEQQGEFEQDGFEQDEFENHPFFRDGEDATGDEGSASDKHGDGEYADEHDGEYADEYDDEYDDEYGDDPADTRRWTKKRRGGTTKRRRSGSACLVIALLFTGVAGGGGYVGYQYWQAHFAAPPDYTGQGTGSVEVDIPDGATLAAMGNILKQAGVVKSVDAFTAAAAKTGANLQGGSYEMREQMSAAAAVALMLDPSSQNSIVIPEGLRASQIFARLDKRLGLSGGTTAAAAQHTDLGLPSYAGGNPEGFLFPIRYSLGKDAKPGDILAQMVKQAEAEYARDDLEAQARRAGMSPYQVIIIASLIQAEAKQPQDFGKVSRVIYNRLAQNMALGFDSTINYAMGRSTLNTTTADTRYQSPYNTYLHKGLPPGPIDNPGHEAIEAALNPTAGDWLYFVTVKPGDTRFTASAAEHQRNVAAFNQYQQEHGG